MKTASRSNSVFPVQPTPVGPPLAILLGAVVLGLLPASSSGQSDDFNDGNDLGWIRYDPISSTAYGPQATWSFPNGGCRIQTAVSPNPALVGPGRAGSYRTNQYSDFYVAADLINWNASVSQAFGLLGRTADVGLGQTDGYALTYQAASHNLNLTRFSNESPVTLPTGLDSVTFVPGHTYRLVFLGRGSALEGRVYEWPDTLHPLIVITTTDATYPAGVCGLVMFDNSGGTMVTDATFDNYFASDVEPPRLTVSRASLSTVTVSWLLPAPGYQLQSAALLSAGAWTNVSPALLTTNANLVSYSEAVSSGTTFFRVRRP